MSDDYTNDLFGQWKKAADAVDASGRAYDIYGQIKRVADVADPGGNAKDLFGQLKRIADFENPGGNAHDLFGQIKRIADVVTPGNGANDIYGAVMSIALTLGVTRSISGAYVGPGDLATGATAWFGLRAYSRATAGGDAIDIIRASDNTTQTIKTLLNGSLNVGALTTFLSGTTGKCSKLYDQTGNGNHLLQATGANQPSISLNAAGGSPALLFDGTASYLSGTFISSLVQPCSFTSVVEQVTLPAGGNAAYLCFANSIQVTFGSSGFVPDQVAMYAGGSFTAFAAAHGSFHSINGVFNNASSVIVIDGVTNSFDLGAGGGFGSGTMYLGSDNGPGNFCNCLITEIGVWPYLLTP